MGTTGSGVPYIVTGFETQDRSAFSSESVGTTWAITYPAAGRVATYAMQVSGGGVGGAAGAYVEQILDSTTGTCKPAVSGSETAASGVKIVRFYHQITAFPAAGNAEQVTICRLRDGPAATNRCNIRVERTPTGTIFYSVDGNLLYDLGTAGADSTWRRIEVVTGTTAHHVRISTVNSNTILGEYRLLVAPGASTGWDTFRLGVMPTNFATQHATHTHLFDDLTVVDGGYDAATSWLGDGTVRGPVTVTGAGSFAEMCDDATPTTPNTSVYTNLTEAWPTPDQTSYNLPDVGGGTALRRDAWATANSAGVTGQVIRWGLHTYAAGIGGSNTFHFAGLYSGSTWVEATHYWTNSDATWHYGMVGGNIANTTTFDAAEIAYRRTTTDTTAVQFSAVQMEYEDDQGLTPLPFDPYIPAATNINQTVHRSTVW